MDVSDGAVGSSSQSSSAAVDDDDDDPSATAAAKPPPLVDAVTPIVTSERKSHGNVSFTAGDAVTLQCLQAKPELNGQRATVLGLDAPSGRYKVRLSSAAAGSGAAAACIKVKPECLLPVLDDEGGPEGSGDYMSNY